MNEVDLKDKSIRFSDVSILSAYDVDINLLADFYNNNPLDNSSLVKHWEWKFRTSSFANKIPLVMVYNGRIIAHVGLVPFEVFLCGKKHTAAWMTDLSILPEFRSRGAGMGRRLIALTKKWMEFSDLNLAIGNDYAINFLNHFGWIESFDTYLHRFLLLPFNRPALTSPIHKFSCNVLKNISRNILKVVYKKYAASIKELYMYGLNQNIINEFLNMLYEPDKGVMPSRDIDYANWRLLCSPDKEKYRMVTIEGNDVKIIIKLIDDKPYKHIEILWMTGQSNLASVKEAISTLAVWGIKNSYSMIRYYTSHKIVSDYLKKSLKSVVDHPRFSFYSKDNTLLQKATNTIWHWQLIDSDFETF
jgi:hypothetical protein